MPYGDGTGPLGRGPRTGRAAGYCSGYPAPGFVNPMGRGYGAGGGRGRGFGRGRGRGHRRFWRNPYYPSPLTAEPREPYIGPAYGPYYGEPDPDEEKSYLENVLQSLESEIKGIKRRLKMLSKEKE